MNNRSVLGNERVSSKEDEFSLLFSTLQADINDIYPYSSHDEPGMVSYRDPVYLSQGQRRNLVRAVFAFIEGNAYFLRRSIVEDWGDRISGPTQLALKELQVEVTNSGLVRTKPSKVSALAMLRLTVASYATILPNLEQLKCVGPKFEALTRSIKVRDRLMHPKEVQALNVSDEEIRDIAIAFSWFSGVMLVILRENSIELKRILAELRFGTV